MHLDIATLMVAGAFVAMMSGMLLLVAWYQFREMSPVLWWAAANFVRGVGIALIAFGGSSADQAALAAAFTLVGVSDALVYTSVRAFTGLRFNLLLLAGGPLLALGANLLCRFVGQAEWGAAVSSLPSIAYLFAAAWMVAFRLPAAVRSRWPLAALLAAHAATLLAGSVEMALVPLENPYLPSLQTVFGIIHFEAVVFLIGTTIFIVAGMREMSEMIVRKSAETDALTGLPNRRAFMDAAARLVERSGREGGAAVLIAFDLDHFKAVNDTFGHEIGDRTLQVFADVCRKGFRPNDTVARIGGEEFAAILPGTDLEAGMAMAERIRKAFAAAADEVDGRPVRGTLSAGVAGNVVGATVQDLLRAADAALYRAKLNGRNRVEHIRQGPPPEPRKLVRVA